MEKLTIGSDPEFAIRNAYGDLTSAYNVIIKPGLGTGEIGVDGWDKIGELRPQYADCPLKHSLRIQQLISHIEKKILPTGYSLHGGSRHEALSGSVREGVSLGGHIHFNASVSQKLLDALDVYLSIPLMMMEESSQIRRRDDSSFGKLSNEEHNKTAHDGFEYRTPPSFLVSKGLCTSVLCLAYTIVYDIHNKKSTTQESLLDYLRSNEKKFYEQDKSAFRMHIPKIFLRVKEMEKYKLYSSEIKNLFRMIENKQTMQEQRDSVPRFSKQKLPSAIVGDNSWRIYETLYKISNNDLAPSNRKMFVYGLAKTRGCDLAINNDKLVKKARKIYPNLEIRNAFYSRRFKDNPADIGVDAIGMSRQMRKNMNETRKMILKISNSR